MAEIFISYARSTAAKAQQIAEALRALGYGVWRDDELPAHRSYGDVIEERLKAAKAVVVIWSAEGVKSEWVRSEADRARNDRKLVQLSVDGTALPMPFDQIQCADLNGWAGDLTAPGWRKVVASIADLMGGAPTLVQTSSAPELKLPNKPSIAVLPFANLSNDPEQAYFADGMTEEITNALSRFPTLFVIASGSTAGYRDGARNLKRIAAELGVRYVLEGSVQKAAGRVRIAVKLSDAAQGAQIWTDRFDDTLEDIFALQDKVTSSVAGAIDSTLSTAEIRRARARPTEDLDAYDLCLRGLGLVMEWDRASILKALDFLDAAIARDPDYAQALAMAGYGWHQLWISGWADKPDECHARALGYCRRALRHGREDPLVLSWAAVTLMGLGEDIAEADRLAEQSLAISPGSAHNLHLNGWIKAVQARSELAVSNFEQSLRLDPRSPLRPYHMLGMGIARFAQRRFDDALALIAETVQALPDYPQARGFQIACLAHLGRLNESREIWRRAPTAFDAALVLMRDPAGRAILMSARMLLAAKVSDG